MGKQVAAGAPKKSQGKGYKIEQHQEGVTYISGEALLG